MIARLRGQLVEKQPNSAIVDIAGVGYALTIPVSTYSEIGEAGANVSLHVHTHVREDALALFGFSTRHEKSLFELLITVNGVGPRLAIAVLSGLPTPELLTAIRSGDGKTLTRIPGVGRKTGERIILELREKLGPIEAPEGEQAAAPASGVEADVLSAMLNLGCTADAAEKALRSAREAGAPNEFEPLFRKAFALVRR